MFFPNAHFISVRSESATIVSILWERSTPRSTSWGRQYRLPGGDNIGSPCPNRRRDSPDIHSAIEPLTVLDIVCHHSKCFPYACAFVQISWGSADYAESIPRRPRSIASHNAIVFTASSSGLHGGVSLRIQSAKWQVSLKSAPPTALRSSASSDSCPSR